MLTAKFYYTSISNIYKLMFTLVHIVSVFNNDNINRIFDSNFKQQQKNTYKTRFGTIRPYTAI